MSETRAAGAVADGDERRHRRVLDTIPHIVWAGRADGVIDYLNRFGEEQLGVSSGEISGARWLELVHPDDRERTRDAWRAATEAGSVYRIEYRLRGPGGDYRWYLSQAVPLRDPDGAVRRWVGTSTEIDALKRTEEELRASESRFQQIAESIEEVFWLTDARRSEIVYVNRAYETIWGRSRESLYADGSSWLDAVHPDDRDRVRTASALEAEGEYDETYRIVRPDGEQRWIRERAFPVRDEKGEVIRITGVAEDVTERRRLEESLREAQKVEAIGLLAGGVAHDFNNVLTAIIGNAELALGRVEEDAPIRGDMQGVLAAAASATTLTRQLLVFSRRKVVAPRPVSLSAALTEIEPMLRRLIPSSIALRVEPGDAPAVTVIDPGHLEQVVMNLVVNARDAMPRGGTLHVRTLVDRGAERHRVGYEVEDTGVGMDEELQGRVFEPLFTTKESGQGTGLGLFIVQGIVEDTGGVIALDSAPGAGTTFRVYFPAAAADQVAIPEDETRPVAAGRGGETVLVVEDNAAVAALAETVLGREGYEVVVTADGTEALERVRSGECVPDLVMTDVVLPRMSGPELAERLLELGVEVPLLFTSGYPESGRGTPAVPERARFLEKPFTPESLTREVRDILDRHAGR